MILPRSFGARWAALLLLVVFSWRCSPSNVPPSASSPSESESGQSFETAPSRGGPCDGGLFRETAGSAEAAEALDRDPAVIRWRFVEVDFESLTAGTSSEELSLNLFEDVCFVAVRDDLEVRGDESLTWLGHLKAIPESRVSLVVEKDALAGSIHAVEALFHIRFVSDGIHAVLQIDQSAYPPEGEPLPPEGTTTTTAGGSGSEP